MDAFEPPKYLTSLIAAINDGAKSAQAGALAFTLIGLFLVATAFSVTDEDLLLEHTTPILQIGVQLPVVFSFAIAPAAFVFVHVYTLIRYDMLAANLHQFRSELRDTVPLAEDRERCRQLLGNVEFVQAWTAPRGSGLYSRLYSVVAWAVLAGFPVATLIIVQMSSLRYQSDAVTVFQKIWLALDLALLWWFFHRQRRWGRLAEPASRVARVADLAWRPAAALVILALDLLYLNVPPRDATADQVVRDEPAWSEAYRQLLDFGVCPALHFGCRYLRVEDRLLVNHVWVPQAVAELKAAKPNDIQKSLAGIDGLYLRSRTLRFAVFRGSRLYAAILSFADLSGAILSFADLSGADLFRADLSGAHLFHANLSGANLIRAHLFHAHLSGAYLPTVRFLTQKQLNDACGDSDTKLPEGLTIPPCYKPK
jgi:hypothetical protein